ncbi:MAG: type II toxin-antitoxin system VapC family toxin [Betaproteobacteria bacterium]|nr:type II toxin-antitoxin system VapC family toxin [Betaproteobacteria bacterium]
MLRFMLDTDTCSDLIRGGMPGLDAAISKKSPATLCMSVVSRAELLFGVERRGRLPKLAALVARFLQQVPSLAWDDNVAHVYAAVRAEMESSGKLIGNLDMMIAAHALATDLALVTNNERHFKRVPGLCLENWAK